MPDSFDLSAVREALAGTIFAEQLQHFQSVGSTNILALEAAKAGAKHGSVWIADQQTAGRGRSDHKWHSTAEDGLYVSVLLRPRLALLDALLLSLAAGLAAQTAISTVTGLTPDLRWPNDLMIDNKKCGGILTETSVIASQLDAAVMLHYAVVGVGINLNHRSFPPELESLATSLRCETGKSWAREPILSEFLRELESEIAQLERELRGTSPARGLLDRFTAASSWVRGRHVNVDEAGGYTGVTDGLDARGFLRVAGDDGVMHTVFSGGVRAR